MTPGGRLGQCEREGKADTILRSLTVFPDRLSPEAEADRANVTLPPCESITFTIDADGPLPGRLLGVCPVLRCMNDPTHPEAS